MSGDSKKIWTYDAGEYLREALAKYRGDLIVQRFRDFERALGHPLQKVHMRITFIAVFLSNNPTRLLLDQTPSNRPICCAAVPLSMGQRAEPQFLAHTYETSARTSPSHFELVQSYPTA
jgi:hypothetical protein